MLKIIEDDNNFHDYLSKTYLNNNNEKKKVVHYFPKKDRTKSLDNHNIISHSNSNSILDKHNTQLNQLPSLTNTNAWLVGSHDHANTSDGFKSTFRERKRFDASLQQLISVKKSMKHVNIKEKNNMMFKLNRMETFIATKTSFNPNLNSSIHNSLASIRDSVDGGSGGNFQLQASQDINSTINGGNLTSFQNVNQSLKTMSSTNKTGHNKSKSVANESQFLNTYKLEKIELTNKNVKDLFMEVNKYGPAFQFCGQCNNKNLGYYQEMRPENAIKLLNHIKVYKKEHHLEL